MTETQVPSPLRSMLTDAQAKVEGGDYRGAMQVVRDAKAAEPRNIYVLAFEKQVEQLAEMSDLKLLTDDQRGDILESLPGIIERAVEGSSGPAGTPPPTDTRADLNREREERGAALEWLKNQYFQHAHDYVRKGEYQHALAEIRRVYIIDPNNKIAKDFEQQIDQLIVLKREQTTTRQSVPSASVPPPETKGKATSAVPAGSATAAAPDASPEPAGEKKPLNWTLITAIILTLIAAGIAVFYFMKREKMNRPPAPSEQSVTEVVEAQSPTLSEQSFTIAQMDGGGIVRTSAVPEASPSSSVPANQPDQFLPDRGGGGSARARPIAPTASQSPLPRTPPVTEPRPETDGNPPATRGESQSSPRSAEEMIEDARIVRLERPRLPEGIYASGLEGQVVVRVELDAEGNPRQVRILRSSNDLLDNAVIDAVTRSQFSPRRLQSGPVASAITVPFTFRTKR